MQGFQSAVLLERFLPQFESASLQPPHQNSAPIGTFLKLTARVARSSQLLPGTLLVMILSSLFVLAASGSNR